MFLRLSWIALYLLCSAQAYADFDVFGTGTNQFQIEFVTVGDPGNDYDPTTVYGPGKVDYEYRIAKFEISREMIDKASSAGALSLTMADMSSLGGNGSKRAATGLSWNEAARFVNWLNISNGFTAAYKFAFQPGEIGYNANDNLQLWDSTETGYTSSNPFRNSLAKYFLPSLDEWHKAAYHDPSYTSGPVKNYRQYATTANPDVAPTPVADGTNQNTAVYDQLSNQGPADIDNAGGLSYWGTMGQGGNVFEWNESTLPPVASLPGSERVIRGGSWASSYDIGSNYGYDLNSTDFHEVLPDFSASFLDENQIGFRIASTSSSAVPEPSSWILVSVSAACGWIYKRRRSRVKQQPTQNQLD